MNIQEIVKDYLIKNGYTGLFCSDVECGCELDDLFPCGEFADGCVPGTKESCNCSEHDGWHIKEGK